MASYQDKLKVLASVAERLAHEDVGNLVLEVRGFCSRENFESTVKIGDQVFRKLQGKVRRVHSRSSRRQGRTRRPGSCARGALTPFLRIGRFLYVSLVSLDNYIEDSSQANCLIISCVDWPPAVSFKALVHSVAQQRFLICHGTPSSSYP